MRDCPPCKGTGRQWGSSSVACRLCNGEGLIGNPQSDEVLCHWCGGNGRKNGTQLVLCDKCRGCGYRKRNIPAEELIKELGVMEPTGHDGPCVVYIEAGKPRTAHLTLVPILEALTGDIRVCDPYYGTGSLVRLDAIATKPVRFLTRTPDSKEQLAGQIPRAFTEFTKQHPNVEVREYPANDLHDRYIVSQSELILLGHGLKDIGNKDSFVVRLNRDLAGDMIDHVIQAFDSKWATATKLA